jgi:hypothetical protein
MTFALTPKTAFPRPQADGFPQGVQYQDDGTNLGDRHVQTVDFIGGVVTRLGDKLTVPLGTTLTIEEDGVEVAEDVTRISFNGDLAVSVESGPSGKVNVSVSGGGGGGVTSLFSATRQTTNQTSGSTVVFNDATAALGFTDGNLNLSTGEYTVQADGKYEFSVSVACENDQTTEYFYAAFNLRVNRGGPITEFGGQSIPIAPVGGEAGSAPGLGTLSFSSGPMALLAGDKVSVSVNSGIGSPGNTLSSTRQVLGSGRTRFSGKRLSLDA